MQGAMSMRPLACLKRMGHREGKNWDPCHWQTCKTSRAPHCLYRLDDELIALRGPQISRYESLIASHQPLFALRDLISLLDAGQLQRVSPKNSGSGFWQVAAKQMASGR